MLKIRSYAPVTYFWPFLMGFMVVWASAMWFLADVPHKPAAGRLWITLVALYSIMGISLFLAVRRRSLSVDTNRITWSHIPVADVNGGLFPSSNGFRPVAAVNAISRLHSGLVIRFADGSRLLVNNHVNGVGRVRLFADALSSVTGKEIKDETPSVHEVMSGLPDDLRAELEKHIKPPASS